MMEEGGGRWAKERYLLERFVLDVESVAAHYVEEVVSVISSHQALHPPDPVEAKELEDFEDRGGRARVEVREEEEGSEVRKRRTESLELEEGRIRDAELFTS